MSDLVPEAEPTTRDALFLAASRPAMVYGIPLEGFLLAIYAPVFVFAFTRNYGLLRSGISCAVGFVAVLAALQALTSWEHRWPAILLAWFETTAPALLSRHTRTYGGTTFRPTPTSALRRDIEEYRDYAG